MIISRTPFRISFFGGGTDYPKWSREHGGEVLATTINKYCYITCRYLPPFFEHRYRMVYSQIEDCMTIDDIKHPAIREVLKYLNINRGLEIHHDGDLPARSGMGSSSSFAVGLLHALYGLTGKMTSKQKLADEGIHVEQEILKETVGSQDQVMAAYGGLNHVTFPREGDIAVRPVTLSPERKQDLNDHLMLFYTAIQRNASDVAKSYIEDTASKESQIRSMMDMVDEGISILSEGRDINSFGELLDEAWKAKSSLGGLVTNSHIDEIYGNAKNAGAIGGKLLGAGGGGFMLLFAPPEKQAKIKERLDRLIQVPFQFESSGTQIIFYDHDEDYTGVEQTRESQRIQAFRELS